jgi:hypothetical protein
VRRPLQIALLILAALATLSVMAGPAAAKTTPCWQTLIDDWYDGRIDSVYPVACYRAALEHMPEDVANYSSLGDDINRALAAAIAAENGGGSSGSGTGGSGSGGSGSSSSSSGSKEQSSTFHGGPTSDRFAASLNGRDEPAGPIPSVINSIGPDDASSVPVPLIVLAALALLLLVLGSAGFVARRMQTKRASARAGAKS